ncbi:MAG: pseudouridine synthase [Planctomycetota bacterium]
MSPRREPAREAVRRTLDRLLSRSGVCSRAQALELLAAGRVSVDGHVVRSAEVWVDPLTQHVTVNGTSLEQLGVSGAQAGSHRYVMLHKPKDCVTTRSDEKGRRTVYDLLTDTQRHDAASGESDAPGWIAPVGRLDRDTTGLLLLTSDNDLAELLTNPASHLPKVYRVTVADRLSETQIEALRQGVALPTAATERGPRGRTRPAKVELLQEPPAGRVLRLAISEGRNRQVRRMFEALGSRVVALHREAIGPLPLGDLPLGAWRELSAAEVAALRRAVALPRRKPAAS